MWSKEQSNVTLIGIVSKLKFIGKGKKKKKNCFMKWSILRILIKPSMK